MIALKLSSSVIARVWPKNSNRVLYHRSILFLCDGEAASSYRGSHLFFVQRIEENPCDYKRMTMVAMEESRTVLKRRDFN